MLRSLPESWTLLSFVAGGSVCKCSKNTTRQRPENDQERVVTPNLSNQSDRLSSHHCQLFFFSGSILPTTLFFANVNLRFSLEMCLYHAPCDRRHHTRYLILVTCQAGSAQHPHLICHASHKNMNRVSARIRLQNGRQILPYSRVLLLCSRSRS